MTNEEYHAHPAYSSSDVRVLLNAPPAILRWRKTEKPPSAPTPAMQRGTWTHTLVLEPEKWVEPPKLTAAEARNLEQARAMAAAVQAHPAAAAILRRAALIEDSVILKDRATKIQIKARPDILTDNDWLVDVKSSSDISDSSFPWNFRKARSSFRYDLQFSHYLRVLAQSRDHATPKGALVIAVESNPPWPVRVLEIPLSILDSAAAELSDLLQTIATCEKSKKWPGYSDRPEMLQLP